MAQEIDVWTVVKNFQSSLSTNHFAVGKLRDEDALLILSEDLDWSDLTDLLKELDDAGYVPSELHLDRDFLPFITLAQKSDENPSGNGEVTEAVS